MRWIETIFRIKSKVPPPNNFGDKNHISLENSPLHFEIKALIEEFKCTRAEVNLHLSNEQQITNITATLIAGTIAATQLLPSLNVLTTPTSLWSFLLVASLLLTSLAFMYLGEDVFISQLATYVQQVLRPKMEAILFKASGEKINMWEWDEFYNKNVFYSARVIPATFISIAKFALPTLPSLIILIAYLNQRGQRKSIPSGENILFFLSVIYTVMLAVTMIFTLASFLSMSPGGITNQIPTSAMEKNVSKVKNNLKISWEAVIFLLTLALGFVPLLVLSLTTGGFWFSSKYDFPLIMIPNILLGDSLILPFFNYRLSVLLRKKLGTKYLTTRKGVGLILGISIFFSFITTSYTHYIWTHDNYIGFLDPTFGQLSLAGWIHFFFSVIQMSAVIFLVGLIGLIYKDRLSDAYQYAYNTWVLLVPFSLLGVLDIIMKHVFILKNYDMWTAFKLDWSSLILLATTIFVLLLSRLGLREENVD